MDLLLLKKVLFIILDTQKYSEEELTRRDLNKFQVPGTVESFAASCHDRKTLALFCT